MSGPLAGVRVLEVAGIGPGPFAAMLLADLGASVTRLDRVTPVDQGVVPTASKDVLARSRRSISVDLKQPAGVALTLRLVEGADALLEGFRPGVAERLGIGPQICLERNPRLVYARVTGWGQEGPWAQRAGHDLDYIALAGALHPIGTPEEPPPVPMNYIGDFGGGGMLIALGIACALLEAERSGRGQVVDAAMIDGAAAQTAMVHGLLAMGLWEDRRQVNLLDGAAPFYRCYRCADGRDIAVGALEPQFYAELLDRLGLPAEDWPQHDRSRWPQQAAALAELFATRSRDAWMEVFAGSDACVAPVLSLTEAPTHAHHQARGTFVDVAGVTQPAPAPRFSRTAAEEPSPPCHPGTHTDEVLRDAGLSDDEITDLRGDGVVA